MATAGSGFEKTTFMVPQAREFTGSWRCGTLQFLSSRSTNALNGIAVAPEFVFLARAIHAVDAGSDDQAAEGIDAISWVPFAEVLAMIRRGDIHDGESVAALAYAGIHLGRFS